MADDENNKFSPPMDKQPDAGDAEEAENTPFYVTPANNEMDTQGTEGKAESQRDDTECSNLPMMVESANNLSVASNSPQGTTRNQRQRSPLPAAYNTQSMDHSGEGSSANGVAAYVRESANHANNTKARNQSRRRRHESDQQEAEEKDGQELLVGDDGLYQPILQPPIEVNDRRVLNHGSVPYNWQATQKSVRDRLSYIFNSESMADVHFVVGKGPNQVQRIPAHKFVLSIGSAVFDAMFNGGMATTSSEVELTDVEPAAFLALLKFLYTDEVGIGPETVMTTLYTAKKYAVPALEKACVDFLKRNLSSDNAFMLLTQARLFDEPQLAALCLETIDKNTSEALAAEGFTDIDLDTLCVVLERDTLGIRECKLFSAVGRWAEAECGRQNYQSTPENQRLCLSRALQLIRFPLMTVEEFAQGAAQSGILLDREVVQLFLYFTVNPKPSVGFLDTPRCCLTGKEHLVSRFCQIESRWGYSGTSDRIRFVVNRRIFVVGFGLYGSIHGPSEYTVNIQIIHTDTGKICGQNDCSFQCDGSTSTFRVMFKEPVEVQPNCSYTACATLKGPDSYYGTKGLRKVTHESVSSGKVTFQFTYAAGNNNGTSVEDGQIPEIIFYT